MEKKLLNNKVAVITGASRGIGREIALCYAKEGASLMIICLEEEECLMEVHREIEKLGAKSSIIIGDISNFELCKKIYSETISQYGRTDILVNCAGAITRSPFEEMT